MPAGCWPRGLWRAGEADEGGDAGGLLADVASDPVLAPALRGGAGYVRELMVVGQVADAMIVSSQRTDGKTHVKRDD
jgi:hypothetical protein